MTRVYRWKVAGLRVLNQDSSYFIMGDESEIRNCGNAP